MKTVRILSILFLLFCLAFVFASCDNERPQEIAETEKTAETGQVKNPKFLSSNSRRKLDYGKES